jgi:hypothetical protein
MQGAKHQASSPKPRPPHSISTGRQVSNRNTPEFRISPNPNKTPSIAISNRNNNPDVAVVFLQRTFTQTKEGPRLATSNPFLITDPRLETTPKTLKTKAVDEF